MVNREQVTLKLHARQTIAERLRTFRGNTTEERTCQEMNINYQVSNTTLEYQRENATLDIA